jgi:hypothetical protein
MFSNATTAVIVLVSNSTPAHRQRYAGLYLIPYLLFIIIITFFDLYRKRRKMSISLSIYLYIYIYIYTCSTYV